MWYRENGADINAKDKNGKTALERTDSFARPNTVLREALKNE